jgi:hypothetical protein
LKTHSWSKTITLSRSTTPQIKIVNFYLLTYLGKHLPDSETNETPTKRQKSAQKRNQKRKNTTTVCYKEDTIHSNATKESSSQITPIGQTTPIPYIVRAPKSDTVSTTTQNSVSELKDEIIQLKQSVWKKS